MVLRPPTQDELRDPVFMPEYEREIAFGHRLDAWVFGLLFLALCGSLLYRAWTEPQPVPAAAACHCGAAR